MFYEVMMNNACMVSAGWLVESDHIDNNKNISKLSSYSIIYYKKKFS